MSKQGSEFYENFTKNIYETIKGFGDDDRGDFIIHTYENLYGKLKDGEEPGGTSVDLAKLREDLSHIRGIGGQRLDEIMAVIKRNLTPEKQPEPPIARADSIPEENAGNEADGGDDSEISEE